jgi:hypothetical protein
MPGPNVPAGTEIANAPVVFAYPPTMPGMATNPPKVTAPAVPATGVAVTNNTTVSVMVYVAAAAASAVTQVAIGGINTGITIAASSGEGGIWLPAGTTIALTYSGTVTWVWLAA